MDLSPNVSEPCCLGGWSFGGIGGKYCAPSCHMGFPGRKHETGSMVPAQTATSRHKPTNITSMGMSITRPLATGVSKHYNARCARTQDSRIRKSRKIKERFSGLLSLCNTLSMCMVLTKQTALPECIYTRTYYVRCGELKFAMSFMDTPFKANPHLAGFIKNA